MAERKTAEGSQPEDLGDQIIHRIAELADIRGGSSGPMASGELDIAGELSAISIAEEAQRQFLEEVESFP